MEGIKEHRNTRNGFYVLWCHYSADPKKRSQEWKLEQSQGIPQNDWNREYEIDFSSFAGKPVFLHDYDDARMWKSCEVSPKFPIIRSWDFGYHHPAVTWSQFIDGQRLVVLQSDMGSDIDFRLYVKHILHLGHVYFSDREFLDCCDRAGDFDRPTGDSEVRILTNEFGIIPRYKYFRVEHTIELLRDLMNSNYRGLPCFMVNDSASNRFLRDALRGGYHYAEKVEGRPEKESPFQDGYYENIIDPIRYTVGNFFGNSGDTMRDLERISLIDILPEKELVY